MSTENSTGSKIFKYIIIIILILVLGPYAIRFAQRWGGPAMACALIVLAAVLLFAPINYFFGPFVEFDWYI